MLRRFLKDSAVYGIGAVATRAIGLLLVPLYTRMLAPTDFGAIDILAVFGSIISVTIALEISQGLPRYYLDTPAPEERRAYASTAFWFTLGIYGAFLLVGMSFAPALARTLLGSTAWLPVLSVALIAISLNGVYYLLQNQLRWQIRPVAYTLVSLTYVLVTATFAVLLVVVFRKGVVGVFVGQVIGASVASVAAWFLAREDYRLQFDLRHFRNMVGFSSPLIPSSVAVFVAAYVDRIALKYLVGIAAVGIYGVAFRFGSVTSLAMAGFQGALTPLVYEHYTESSTPAALARIFRLFVAITLPTLVVIAAFAKDILWLFTTPKYFDAAPLIPLLALSCLIGSMYIFAPGLAIEKRTRLIAFVNIGAGLGNFGLNVLLLPLIGLPGAAIATLMSASGGFVCSMIISQRLYHVPHRWGGMLAAACCSAAIAVMAYYAGPPASLWPTLLRLCGVLGAVAVSAAILVDRKEIGRLMGRPNSSAVIFGGATR